MTNILFMSAMLFCICADPNEPVVWEQFTKEQQRMVVANLSQDDNARRYYNKEFELSDNDETFALLDQLSNLPNDRKLSAFYIYLFNTILLTSDGALSEAMEEYCCKLFERAPAIIMTEFEFNKSLMDYYAFGIVRTYDLYVKPDNHFDRIYKLAIEQSGGRKDIALYFVELIKKYRNEENEKSKKNKLMQKEYGIVPNK